MGRERHSRRRRRGPTGRDCAPRGDAARDCACRRSRARSAFTTRIPNSVAGTTAFAAFTGKGLEPLDQQKVFVDMNRNGVWDERETPEQAWRRLGLLAANEAFTRERYVACVEKAARALAADGFLSDATTARVYRASEETEF